MMYKSIEEQSFKFQTELKREPLLTILSFYPILSFIYAAAYVFNKGYRAHLVIV